MHHKITPFLWFDYQAAEAVDFYLSVFKHGKLLKVTHYNDAHKKVTDKPAGSVMTVDFQIEGQYFTAINGGPDFKFNPSVSFVVHCDTQEEVDYYWDKLTADGGQEMECGWLTDKFGISWQITPKVLLDLIHDPDRAAAVTAAMLKMKKLDIEKLKEAA